MTEFTSITRAGGCDGTTVEWLIFFRSNHPAGGGVELTPGNCYAHSQTSCPPRGLGTHGMAGTVRSRPTKDWLAYPVPRAPVIGASQIRVRTRPRAMRSTGFLEPLRARHPTSCSGLERIDQLCEVPSSAMTRMRSAPFPPLRIAPGCEEIGAH